MLRPWARRLPLFAVLLAALLALTPVPAASEAQRPPQLRKELVNGQWSVPGVALRPAPELESASLATSFDQELWLRLVYNVYDPGGQDWEIYRGLVGKNVDGGIWYSSLALTNNNSNELSPRLSPDAETLLFSSDRSGNYELYRMPLAGGDLVQLTADPASDLGAVWSPDGSRVAFASLRDGNWNIYVVGRDGGAPQRLTSDPADDVAPTWSPDGRSLAWVRAGDRTGTLWVMGADGKAPRAITAPLSYLQNPAWSPDGELIGFDYDANGDGFNRPGVVRPDGRDLREVPLVNNASWIDPADIIVNGWSPDGDRLMGTLFQYAFDGSRLLIASSDSVRMSLVDRTVAGIGMDSLEAYPDGRSIDRSPPAARLAALPAYERAGRVELQWEASDAGIAGLGRVEFQYRVGSGAWASLPAVTGLNGVIATGGSFVYSGLAGQTVSFRTRARDDSGNQGPWRATGDTTTRFFTTFLTGRVLDSRGYPAVATLSLAPAGLEPAAIDGAGRFLARLQGAGQHTVTVSAPGLTPPPSMTVVADQDRRFEAMLLPADSLIGNGGFEQGGLSGWSSAGTLPAPRAVAPGFTGAGAVQLGAPCTGACLSAPEAVPLTTDSTVPSFAVGQDGRQHLLYYEYAFGALAYVTRLPGEAWSAPVNMGSLTDSALAVDSGGVVHLVGRDAQRKLAHRSRALDGSWSETVNLGLAQAPLSIYTDAAGRLMILFRCDSQTACPGTAPTYARTRTPGQGWGPPRPVNLVVHASTQAADGRVYIATIIPDSGLFISQLSFDGQIQSTRRLMDKRFFTITGGRIHFAVGPDGSVHAITGVTEKGITYVSCLPEAECGPATAIPQYDGLQTPLVDPGGTLHLLSQFDGGTASYGAVYRRLPPGGSWSAPLVLSPNSYAPTVMHQDLLGQIHILADGNYYSTPRLAAGTSQLSQTVTLPSSMHRPTLAFAYSATGLGPGSASRVAVTVQAPGEPATTVFTTATSTPWKSAWADLSAWAGKKVTVSFTVVQANKAAPVVLTLDDVGLGSWRTPVPQAATVAGAVGGAPGVLTVSGENFIDTPQVFLGTVALQSVQRLSAQQLSVPLPAGFRPGLYQLRVGNPGGPTALGPVVAVGMPVYLPLLRKGP